METTDNTQKSTRSSEQVSQIEEACRLYEGLRQLEHSLEANKNAVLRGWITPAVIIRMVGGYVERAQSFNDVPLIKDLAGKVQEEYHLTF